MEQEELERYRKAGRIASTALREGAAMIKPGILLRDVLDKVEARIEAMGGGIAFPAQLSLNEVAAHYCPSQEDDTAFQEGDVVKLDVGAHVDGRIADNALTIDLGSHEELLKASKEALHAALKIATPGTTLDELGRTIQETITSHGYKPVRNLSGHGLGHYKVHTLPSIPNTPTGDKTALREDMTIAIEPFATDGEGAIQEGGTPTVFSPAARKPTRSPYARQVAGKLQGYHGLPFTTRWLEKEYGVGKTRLALRELQRNGSITPHPPLPERRGGLVSQHEHSVIVKDKPLIYTWFEE